MRVTNTFILTNIENICSNQIEQRQNSSDNKDISKPKNEKVLKSF